MVIDSHEHIMFPIKMQLDKMDAAGVDKTVLFCTAPHPEKAGTLNELEEEMAALNKILAGSNTKEDNISRLKKNIEEVAEAVREYPDRFLGFGAVPLGMELEETEKWIDTQITSNSLYGIGEFTPGNEQQIRQLDTVFQALKNTRIYPVWVHTFHPVTMNIATPKLIQWKTTEMRGNKPFHGFCGFIFWLFESFSCCGSWFALKICTSF